MTRRAKNRELFLEGKRHCLTCNQIKILEEFILESRNWSGRGSSCKVCERARLSQIQKQRYNDGKIKYVSGQDSDRSKRYREANQEKTKIRHQKYKQSERGKKLHRYNENLRRATKLLATPKWASLEKIKQVYLNCPKGYHVDHIVPLRGVNVTGLHVEYNLQYLPAIENIKKGNRLNKVGY